MLLLDGVVSVEVDGSPLVELGPGAVLGERAVLEAGVRTSTVRCLTPCRVAIAPADAIDRGRLAKLAAGHRREDATA
jgi:CRP-like cAMP-binding protein